MSLLEEAVDFKQYNHADMDWKAEGAGSSPQRQFMSRVIDLGPEEVKDKSIIDVGCGSGWFLQECMEKGASQLVGLEPSDLADVAREKIHGATILQETFEDYENYDNGFDLVSFIMSTEHMADLPAILLKAVGLLSDTGTVLVMTGDFEAFQMERFGYIVTVEVLTPKQEVVVRTERPTSFGTTTDIVRSREYWKDVAESVGLSLEQDKPVLADEEYISLIPKYGFFEHKPFMQVFRFTKNMNGLSANK